MKKLLGIFYVLLLMLVLTGCKDKYDAIYCDFDAGDFGRFGVRNWEVSSLTDRRNDAHRHAAYHSEFGPTWQYGIDLSE